MTALRDSTTLDRKGWQGDLGAMHIRLRGPLRGTKIFCVSGQLDEELLIGSTEMEKRTFRQTSPAGPTALTAAKMSDVRTLELLLKAADHVAPMKAQNAKAAQADRNMAPSKSLPVSSSSPTPRKRKMEEVEMGSLPSDEEAEGEEDTQYDNDHFVELADEARRAAGESRLTLAQPLPWLSSSAFTAPSAFAHVGGMTGMMLPGAAPMLAAVPGVNPCFDRRYDTGMPPQAPSAPMLSPRMIRPCTSCRIAKILCDRQLPCTRCVRLNMVCQAPAHVRRGRPPGRRWSCLSNPNQKLEPSALGLPSATSLPGGVPGVGGVLGLDVHVSQLQRMPASTGVFDTALHPERHVERHHHPAAAPFGVAPANMTSPAAWFQTDPRLNQNMTNPNMTFSAAGAPLPPSEYAQPLRPPAHFTATVIAVLPPTASTELPSHSVSASVHGGNFFASAAPQLPAPAPLPVPVDYSVGALRAQLLQLGVLPCI